MKQLEDITGILQYEASSRQAIIGCLIDGNSETFWETGEEVKLKSLKRKFLFQVYFCLEIIYYFCEFFFFCL